MARRLAAIVFVITMFSAVQRAQAQFTWISKCYHSVETDFKRNNCWPEPFSGPDRATVRAPFHIMVHNGWQIQNTMGDHHFDETTGDLTEAAKNRIYWILTQAPVQHRVVYVQRNRDPNVTGRRLQTVQALAASYTGPGENIARIEMSTKPPAGWTAERVGYVSRAFEESAPAPRLSASSSSSSSGGN